MQPAASVRTRRAPRGPRRAEASEPSSSPTSPAAGSWHRHPSSLHGGGRLTAAPGGADRDLMSAVSTTPARTQAEALALPRALAQRLGSPLVQAPAWLLGSMTDAYTAAKLLNAAVMSTAVFPAYWLARRIVRPSFALLTAAAAVATPAMVYHAFLMSEALAYPVFLFAVAILARALAEPSGRIAVAVPGVCAVT